MTPTNVIRSSKSSNYKNSITNDHTTKLIECPHTFMRPKRMVSLSLYQAFTTSEKLTTKMQVRSGCIRSNLRQFCPTLMSHQAVFSLMAIPKVACN
mmetsp:Transcript_16820/g.25718  ORF Transcript_16820/g.25718 Transcript_16820/m.25718 type:complete len:96 (+) Transcript_16820:36-323(+)